MRILRNPIAFILAFLSRRKSAQRLPGFAALEGQARYDVIMLHLARVGKIEPKQVRAALDQCADGKTQNLWRERASGKKVVFRLPHPTADHPLMHFSNKVAQGHPFAGQEEILADFDIYEMLAASGYLHEAKREDFIYGPESTANAEFLKGYRITQAGLSYRARLHHPVKEWMKSNWFALTVAILSTVTSATVAIATIMNLAKNW